jgi:hypothetical protein
LTSWSAGERQQSLRDRDNTQPKASEMKGFWMLRLLFYERCKTESFGKPSQTSTGGNYLLQEVSWEVSLQTSQITLNRTCKCRGEHGSNTQ